MTFLSVNFLRFLFFTQRSSFEVERFVPFGLCHRGLIIPVSNMVWHHIWYGQWTLASYGVWKNYVSGSPLIYAAVALLLCALIIFSFRDELGLVDSLSTLGFLNNLLNEIGCWVKCSLSTEFPNRDYLFLVWKFCSPTFRKRQLLSLTWVSILFISCLFYRFTLFLIFNNGTFFGVACTFLLTGYSLEWLKRDCKVINRCLSIMRQAMILIPGIKRMCLTKIKLQ